MELYLASIRHFCYYHRNLSQSIEIAAAKIMLSIYVNANAVDEDQRKE